MMRPDEPFLCEEALERLEPSLDGDLPPEEEARLQAHLARCPSCAAESALAAGIQRELRALPLHDCPPEVLERVRRAGRVLPFPSRPVRWALAAAMLAVTAGGGVFVVQRRAIEEARFALAYVGQVSRRTGLDLRDDMQQRLVVPATRSLSLSLEEVQAAPEPAEGP